LSADKNASRQRAIETWPEHVRTFARVRDDGRAEAALLALFGARP
jgi:crossover junction endodeoxyribonuclease RuvC